MNVLLVYGNKMNGQASYPSGPALPCTRVKSTWLAAGETATVELCPSSLRSAVFNGGENCRTEVFWHRSIEYLRYF